jgi:hypothetical protein
MTLQNSQILAQAVQGQGGNISIAAGTFLADQTSVVSASSEFGLSGTVTIQSPVSSLSGTLATLPQRPLQAHSLLQQRCAAQSQGQLSSFTVTSRDTLPSEPGGWLMSSMAMLPEPTPVAAAEPVHGLPLSIVQGQFVPGPFAHRRGSSWRGGLMDWIEGCGG